MSKKARISLVQFVTFCFLSFFLSLSQAEVTLTVGNGSDLPGAIDSPVAVSLENQDEQVRGLQVDVCDVDDYLTCTACETTDRTADFSCLVSEITNPDNPSYGCCRVVLFSLDENPPLLIGIGQGSIVTLKYDVSSGAPSGCIDLNQENVSVADENKQPLVVTAEPGGFCFPCTSHADCNDGLYCNGTETCMAGECQAGSNPCLAEEVCDEGDDICVDCLDDADCDDGLFCNGVETCVGGTCLLGTNPCPETECNTCQENTDSCYDPTGTSCDDALFCNGDDTCDGQGNCVYSGNPCPPGATCNESGHVCNCSQDGDCDDGLFCNGMETCVDETCEMGFSYFTDYPCVDCSGFDDCDCDEDSDTCQPATITVEGGSGFRGSTDNPVAVSLDTLFINVKTVTIDVCDVDDYLTCTGCESTERATGFTCSAQESSGCCHVVLYVIGDDVIKVGTGPIFTITYGVSPSAPSGECRGFNPENVNVGNEFLVPLYVNSVPGDFCFYNCSSDQECDNGIFCDGAETCGLDGNCQPGTNPCPGQNCNESTKSCETINTTTTTTPVTTTIPPPPTTSTTTTAIPHSYKVTIFPSSATLDSGATVQFSAKTTDNGEEVAGTYDWEIYPASTIGSEIDDEGIFTAGDNPTDSEIGETVRVTDTDHENISATATVTIKVKIEPPPECEVAINPSSATVSSGEASHLEAETTGDGCLAGDYEWFIDSEIESIIDQEGNYNAGINNTGSHVTDEITVVDHANADITGSATIIVENKIVSVYPDKLLGSRWIPLIYLLLIEGEDTYFKLSSTIEFEPGGDIIELGHLGLGDIFLALLFLDANPQEGTVNIIINNEGEVVTGKVTIELLPSPFAEDYSSSAESYREISFDAATLSDNRSIEKNPL